MTTQMATETMTREQVAKAVRETLASEVGQSVSADDLKDDTGLMSDVLQIDSMTFIRSVIAMEDALGITMGDDLLMQTGFTTVGDLVDYIHETYYAGD